MKRAAGLLALLLLATAMPAQEPSAKGDDAVAARYLSYALSAIDDGRWLDAEAVLNRAADYSANSSELSYYLAFARRKLSRPLGAVLEASRRALEAGRWSRLVADDARLLASECLIELRSFDEAVELLAECAESADAAYLTARALQGSRDSARYLRKMRQSLESYPRDARFVRFLFASATQNAPSDQERVLIDLALSRLPYLLQTDAALAVEAAPFVRDADERRRLVGAYRAVESSPSASSLPIALELGIVQEKDAVEEFFSRSQLDLRLLRETYSHLSAPEARALFSRRCSLFSGTIAEDLDRDGLPESRVIYEKGEIKSFAFDADQDGLLECEVRFSDGLPSGASIAMGADSRSGLPMRPVSDAERSVCVISWERYPFVGSASVGQRTFRFSPNGFPFAPLQLGPLFTASLTRSARLDRGANADSAAARLTERTLYSFASSLEQPGTLLPGAAERVDFAGGKPFRATETLNGKVIALTEYDGGFPSIRRMDLDLDGRYETIVRFKKRSQEKSSIETDFDGDGIFEKDLIK